MQASELKANMRVIGRDGEVYRIGIDLTGGANFRLCYGTTAKGERVATIDRSWVWATRLRFGVRGYPNGFPVGVATELRVSDLRAVPRTAVAS